MPKITDEPLDAIITVLAANLNASQSLVRDFADTFGQPLLPVGHIIQYDISTGRAVIGGNTTFPALGAWRMKNAFAPQTNETRVCTATCSLKYILNANNDTQLMFAVLSRVTREIDNYLDGAVEDDLGGDILSAAGLTEWAVKWDADFKYEIDNQTLYPTMTGKLTFKHDAKFDSRKLQELLSIFCYYNLKGVNWPGHEDLDLDPSGNPLVSEALPHSSGPP